MIADVLHLEKIKHASLELGTQFKLLTPGATEIPQRIEHVSLHVRVTAELDVVEHRHAAKERDILERARQADLGPRRRMQPSDVLTVEFNLAGRRPVKTRYAVE